MVCAGSEGKDNRHLSEEGELKPKGLQHDASKKRGKYRLNPLKVVLLLYPGDEGMVSDRTRQYPGKSGKSFFPASADRIINQNIFFNVFNQYLTINCRSKKRQLDFCT